MGVSQAVHASAAHEARRAAHEGVHPLGQGVAGHLIRVRVRVRVGLGLGLGLGLALGLGLGLGLGLKLRPLLPVPNALSRRAQAFLLSLAQLAGDKPPRRLRLAFL